MTYYERAIALQPDYAQAHCNLGLTLLQLGDYPRGFAEYEWRLQTGQLPPLRCPHPRWDGRPIPDHTLLIHTEQGAGDAIQFARYLPLAARRCRKLLLVCGDDLMPLFATLPGIAELRAAGTMTVAEFDTYLPLLSLPQVFGTTLATIPAAVPYFDVAALRRRKDPAALPQLAPSAQPRVGVVWAGSPIYPYDRQRSCALQDFTAVLQTPGIAFYSLQKGDRQPGAGNGTAGCLRPRPGAMLARLWGHGAVHCPTRSGAHGRYGGGAPGGRHGHAGVGTAARCAGLALAVSRGDDAVVSDYATVSTTPARGLGGGAGGRGPGAGGVARAAEISRDGVRQPGGAQEGGAQVAPQVRG